MRIKGIVFLTLILMTLGVGFDMIREAITVDWGIVNWGELRRDPNSGLILVILIEGILVLVTWLVAWILAPAPDAGSQEG